LVMVAKNWVWSSFGRKRLSLDCLISFISSSFTCHILFMLPCFNWISWDSLLWGNGHGNIKRIHVAITVIFF
jgi:hypothetical protein